MTSVRRAVLAAVPFAAAFAALAAAPSARAEAPADDAALTSERPRLILRPVCPGPLCQPEAALAPRAKGKRVVWLVFDGVQLTRSQSVDDATENKSGIVRQSMMIPAFSTAALDNTGGKSRDAIIDQVVDDLDEMFAAYDVDFVTERPSTGNYSSIVFGGSCASVVGQNGCGGIALMDCNDSMPNNITFVFPAGLDYRDLAPTAAQESAHAFGLAHTNNAAEVMYPVIQFGVYPDHFGDANARCCDGVAVSEGDCYQNEVQLGMTCGRTTQNSHQEMLRIVGPRGQDVYGPTTVITSHTEGQTISAGDKVTAEATDEAGVTKVELLIGNAPQGEPDTSAPYEFSFPEGVAPGEVLLGVRATDSKDNQQIVRLSLYQPGGDDTPCDGDDDCGGGLECNGEFCVPDNGVNELGETCSGNDDCSTTLCGTVDGDSRCTQVCDEATVCPDGFECRGDGTGACWPGGDEGGCGCRTSGAGGLPALLALVGAALFATRRRRPTA